MGDKLPIDKALETGYATPKRRNKNKTAESDGTPYSPHAVPVGTPDLKDVLERQKADEEKAKQAALARTGSGRHTRRKIRRIRRRRRSTKSRK